jgi:dTDP-4-amino-4,6-dideoxygalactose transaminase
VNIPFGNLARQTESVRDDLDAAADRVLRSGQFLFGPEVERFEASFAAWCGVTNAVGVANGTDAITIALQSVGIRPGDEVITAANTCVPTIVGIENAGAIPVLVDCDPATRTIDPHLVEAAIGPQTHTLLPVHLYGQCADMDSLESIASRHGLKLVEDCAQAHGATSGSREAGSFGDAAAFSFYPTKNLGALGDGGAVVTSDQEVAARARLFRNYGEQARFEHVVRGRNSRLDALQAAFLNAKLTKLEQWTERRRQIAERYSDALADSPIVEAPHEALGRRHAYHLYVIETSARDSFRASLAEAGIETAVHYPLPVHRQPAYEGIRRSGSLTVSERLAQQIVSLPLYPELKDDEVEYVCSTLRRLAMSAPTAE